MNNKKQLNKEEKELIQGCINEDPKSQEEFYMRYGEKTFNYALRFTKNHEDAKQWMPEIILKLLHKIKTHKIINLDAWVNKTAWHECVDLDRKEHARNKFIKSVDATSVDATEDHKVIVPGSKKYYEGPDIDAAYKINVPPEIQEGIDKSLEYIRSLYKLKKEIRSNFKKYDPVFRIDDALLETKEKFNYILGPVSDKKMSIYKLSSFKEPFEPPKFTEEGFKKQEFKVWAHSKLNDFLNKIGEVIFICAVVIDKSIPILKSPYFVPFLESDPIKFGSSLIKMKIKPPRLMYEVWSKVKDLRKGKYINQKKMSLIFAYLKKKTIETEREFLFDSVPENITAFSKTINNLRMLSYRKPSNNKFYKELVNFIYEESF